MKIEFSENDLARVVKFLKYSEKVRHAEKYAYILDLKDGRGMLIFNEGGRSAFCKIFDGWKTEWGSGLYNHFSEELWLSYEGGAVELSENGYTINGKFYQDKFIQSGGANGFYKLAIDDEKERQNGSAFRFPCKIKKSENILFSGGKWYSIGFKKGAFTDVSSSGNLEPGAVNISVCFAGENLYKYGIKPGFFTQIFRQWQDRFVLRCYYDNTDFKELVITLSAPSAGVKYACHAADVPFVEIGQEQKKEPLPPSKWNEKQAQKSAENYKRAAAKFDVKKQWGDILHPEGIYVDGENVLFGLEDAKVHIDKKLNGGAGFFVTGDNGKKYLLEMDNNFWESQSGYENDPYNPELFVKMKEGAKYNLWDIYGGDIRDAFSCDLSRVFDAAGNSLDFSYKEEWEEFQIYGYRIDWNTARYIPTHQTDNGRALQVESEDGTASFVLEMDFELDFDFYVNFNLLECLERDYMYKEDIVRVIDAYPVNWNVTDPARRIMAESGNRPTTTNDKEQNEMQPKKEIEPTEPTTAAEIQNKEIQTSEPTPEPTAASAAESTSEPATEQTTEQPEATGWTGRADFHERREARRERREARIEKLEAIAAAPVKAITDDIAYWTQPAYNNAAGRAFAKQREKEANRYFNAIQTRVEAGEKAARLSNIRESTAISSDDPEALDKLRAKLQALKENHEKLKAENKRRRQAGEEPFPWYTLQYSNRDIKRIEERIKELETRQNTDWKDYIFDGGTIEADVADNRYKIFYDEKPEQNIIDFLKSHGWRWSKFNKCWQRLLNRETVRVIESSGKWGYTDYLPGLRVDGDDEPHESEKTAEPEPMEIEPEPQPEQKPVKTVDERQLENVDNIAAELMKKLATLTIYSKEAGTFGENKEESDYIFATFDSVQEASKYACENIVESNNKKTALQIAYMTPEKWEIVSNPGGRWGTWIKVKYKAFYEQFNGEYAGDVFVKFEVWNIDNWGAGKKYYSSYTIIKDGAESWKFEKDTLSFPVEIINPQPEKEQIEMKEEKQTETKQEPELPANFPPAAVRLDPLELWGEPLDYSRVQVIKHNAQECGLALMVYNVKGEGALFAMAPSFWAIVKERSQFEETAQRFIEDNFESVICFFDKEPEGGEIEPEPGDLARNWMQDAAEVKRESVSIPAPATVPAPVVACKLAAPVTIPEPEPKPKTEKPTWTELKYALSLLAMEFSIDDLISKFLKKTSKPVRKSVVEKLLFEIDRGSVPKPGESKREYIKTYYQTH